jgi:type IV pilus assembly protein PilY1
MINTMYQSIQKFSRLICSLAFALPLGFALNASAVTIPNQPLSIQAAAKPMIMLAFGRDHRMFYEAYNDASDIDGDGTLDIRFKPSITYLGLFDPNVCYSHSGASTSNTDVTGLFTPSATAAGALKTCSGQWSGNWLNYVTTSRIDALRVVLYGGSREVDTGGQTILRRGYIPQDAHSWAKEYTSETVDKYKISDYTPLAQPGTNRRHFFGNLTPNSSTNCDPLSSCSNLAPWLSVVTNSNLRVWEWASTERPVLNGNAGGTRANYTVRVQVCTASFNTGCKLYPAGNYKPTGLLHEFGENEAALFGMLSGSYDSHLSGGRLRKVMSSFKNEINVNNGTFIPDIGGIIQNLNAFRIYGFNRGRTDQIYNGSVIGNRTINQGEFPDWGNPVAELMYEASRYFANKGAPTSDYTGATTIDDIMGLSKPNWDRPYAGQGTSTANAPWCSRASLLTISDTNISFDSDQLPGVNSNFGSGISTDLSGRNIITNANSNLNVSTIGDFITANESSIPGLHFIGQVGATSDSAPTAKSVASLSSIRGLAPEEPTKRGSYYAASVAHYTKVNDLNSGLQGNQTIDNFFVALASPLPRIEAKLPNGRVVTLVPFAKSVGGAFSIGNASNQFQPTNQIVDFYVERIANSGPADSDPAVNSGRYEAVFRINYEDVEQGNDHDMDAIVVYTIRARADNTLEVILQPTYQAGGVKHRMGYVISGTTQDGIYLVVQDENESTPYFLNVPPGRLPGYCNTSPLPGDCSRLPYLGGTTTGPATVSTGSATSAISQFVFTPSSTPAATFLKDPMWYAAKWGGFTEINSNGKPDLQQEWDVDGDGQPDTYFFVQNPTKLKDSLTKAFKAITERQGSSSNLASNASTRLETDSYLYRASYVAGKWTGDIEAFPITLVGLGSTPAWRAQDKLPIWSNRQIYMHISNGTVVNTAGTPFTSLPSVDQTSLQNSTLYNYVRGDRSNEANQGGALRNRDNLIGDIIHSSPAYDSDSSTLYVGGNGGMLHAFDGKTGVEKYAFIPRQVIPRLKNLANLNYSQSHEYFIDGEVMLGFKFPETNQSKYLYSLLGRGGKGLFSLNPNPSSNTPALLWEYTPAINTPVAGTTTTAATDNDLGFMLSRPLFALLNNGKVGIILGNGYNSTSGKAVLYIFVINPDGSLFGMKKLDTGVGGDNGLAGASFYDKNGDKKADFVYAGDLKGNLWKFDISSPNSDDWKLAYSSGTPMFKAVDSAGTPQPITAPVISEFNDYGADPNTGKAFVFFGTGSFFQVGDNTNFNLQSFYAIIDNEASPLPTTTPPRSTLVKRSIQNYDAIGGRTVRYVSNGSPADLAGKDGWYIDFDNPINGERVTSRARVIRETIKPSLQFTSFYPINDDLCVPGGDSFFNALEPFTGTSIPVLSNLNGAMSVKLGIGIATSPLYIGSGGGGYCEGNACPCDPSKEKCTPDCPALLRAFLNGNEGITQQDLQACLNQGIKGRISWREIIKE